MSNRADEKMAITRARLCELAEVERGKHGRWQDRQLLPRRRAYNILDALAAAQLDELSQILGPKRSAAVWAQVRNDLGVAGKRLEVMVNLSTLSAALIRSGRELDAHLPRGERVVMVDLTSRSARALSRYRAYEASVPGELGDSAAESASETSPGRAL